MFIHDLIKIKYIHEGYLEDYPASMISDTMMFDAFTRDDGFFDRTYPCIDDSLTDKYIEFKKDLFKQISTYLSNDVSLDSWVYSYMLGASIGPYTDEADIEYLNQLLGVDNSLATSFTVETCEAIYETSVQWLQKLNHKEAQRVPTIFGEPYIIKSLRLSDVDVLGG